MRILHFKRSFSKASETFLYAYITELENQGEENHVLTFERKNEKKRPFPKVNVVDDEPGRWHPTRVWYRLRLLGEAEGPRRSVQMLVDQRTETAIKEIGPDLIHAHMGPEAVRMASFAEKLGIPLVATFYGYDVSQLPKEDDWREKYEDLWPHVDAATVLSQEMKETVVELGCPPEKIRVVHLGRDLDDFSYNAPDRRVQTVLFVGRLVEKKAPLDAIRAVEMANREGAGLSLEIVGEGSLRETLEAYVQENGLSEEVTFYGKVPNSTVAQRMREADAFILSSKTAPSGDREGTPTVLIEAQAAGLPCVTTHHSGIPEMIPEENHDLLAEEGDTKALAGILEELASRTVRELVEVADRGRRKVEREFDLSQEVAALRNVYHSVK
jgi:colanic acid/amylovoran biosynthesis glycosyltransferase